MGLIRCGVALVAASIIVCPAPTAMAAPLYNLTTLVDFNGVNGDGPQGGLVADSQGNMYGTTYQGGTAGGGTVYEIAAGTHAFTQLTNFPGMNVGWLYGALLVDASGNIYGTASGMNYSNGNDGLVFEIAAGTHALTTLATFNGTNGANPTGGLAMDPSGNIYGTTIEGGTNNQGTVFEIAATTHTLSTIYTFNPSSGTGPFAGLISDASGNLYGTTRGGNPSIFEISAGSHAFSTLASLGSANDGGSFFSLSLINNNLYGATDNDGAGDDGVVFELAAGSHTVTDLVTFNGTNGNSGDTTLIADSKGDLFGCYAIGGEYNDGGIFELTAGSDSFVNLASFNSQDGDQPVGAMVLDSHGDLFGATDQGGQGPGTVFELSPVPEPASWLLALVGGIGLLVAYRGRRRTLSRCRPSIWTDHHSPQQFLNRDNFGICCRMIR